MSFLGDTLPLNKKFWRWFGNSAVRHADGSPKIVYHGTRSPLDYYAFETGSVFDDAGNMLVSSSGDPGAHIGPHFTGSQNLASKFASGKGAIWDTMRFVTNDFPDEDGIQPAYGRVIPVFLRITNPKYFDDDEELINFIWKNGESYTIDETLEAEDLENNELDIESVSKLFYNLSNESDEESSLQEIAASELGSSIRHKLEKQGYDGIIYGNTIEGGGLSYCAFSSEQVKSALANRGTWNLKDPNILH